MKISVQNFIHFTCRSTPDPGIQLATVVISGSSLNEIITFDELTDSITVTVTLVDDAVALETVEQYDLSLLLVVNDSRVVLGTPNVATINILDDDCEKLKPLFTILCTCTV